MFTGLVSDIGEVASVETRGAPDHDDFGPNGSKVMNGIDSKSSERDAGGKPVSTLHRPALKRLRILCTYPAETIAIGASIACGGPCLTVVAVGTSGSRTFFEVDVAAETLFRTTAEHWAVGTKLNLERSLKIGDELGGHLVTGHIDAVATIVSIEDFDGMRRISFRVPDDLARFVAEKGSVSLDGTSLTVNSVAGSEFSVLLIPHTLEVTTWKERRVGDTVNLEVDLMARYAARLTQMGG